MFDTRASGGLRDRDSGAPSIGREGGAAGVGRLIPGDDRWEVLETPLWLSRRIAPCLGPRPTARNHSRSRAATGTSGDARGGSESVPRHQAHPLAARARAAGPAATTGGDPAGSSSPVVGQLAAGLWDSWLADRPEWVQAGWFGADLDPQVARLLRLTPGPDLAAALSQLSVRRGHPCRHRHGHAGEGFPGEADPGSRPGCICNCQVVVAAAWEAQASWTQAQATAHLAAVVGDEPVELPRQGPHPSLVDPGREELAAAVRVSPTSMGNRIHAARSLTARPELLAAAESGLCSWWTARSLLAEVEPLSDDEAATIAARIVGKLRERHVAGLAAWTSGDAVAAARRLRLRLYPHSARKAAAAAKSGRRVQLHHKPDGVSDLVATIGTVDAVRIHRRLTAFAAGLDDPTRSRDQKRADTLVDLLLASPRPAGAPAAGADHAGTQEGSTTPTLAPTATPAGADICVVVSLTTLLGLDDEPAHIPGHGPLDPDAARCLAADNAWRAWVTDSAGCVTGVSSRRYTPPPALAQLIRAREPYCRMPGCRRRADLCDLDHTTPWPSGETSAHNLGPLCRRHHNLKTRRRWKLHAVTLGESSGDANSQPPGEPLGNEGPPRRQTTLGASASDEAAPGDAAVGGPRPGPSASDEAAPSGGAVGGPRPDASRPGASASDEAGPGGEAVGGPRPGGGARGSVGSVGETTCVRIAGYIWTLPDGTTITEEIAPPLD